MALQSWLPEGRENLFQEIKKWTVEAEEKGIKPLKLSIGQPTGPALLSAREAAAKAVMSEAESMHEYQDNGSPGVPDFARRFVCAHVGGVLQGVGVGVLPIPGIKPVLGLIPLASGNLSDYILKVATTTSPGYPTPRDWCQYLDAGAHELPLTPENKFRFSVADVEEASSPIDISLVMTNYPHNPTGQIATQQWWEDLCAYCSENNIRLFNDAAYAALRYDGSGSCTLTQVAVEFPELSWVEAFSASKLIGNGTGWRIGAMVGSPDFIADIATIKGNTDSGFVAPMAAGVIHSVENDWSSIDEVRRTYQERSGLLIATLSSSGIRLAVQPGAGFFTLWLVPKKAFGQKIRDAEHFNKLMIERTGVVGVHFNPGYIRYAVTGDIQSMAAGIDEAFEKAEVSYD